MNILKGFESLIQRQSEIDEELKELRTDKNVQKYLELQTEKENIRSAQSMMYKSFKEMQYESCDHMWITTLTETDRPTGIKYDYHGCVKCGLDNSVYFTMRQYGTIDALDETQKMMYDYLQKSHSDHGRVVKAKCDLVTASMLYRRLKKAHPHASDEVLAEYLKRTIRQASELDIIDKGYAKRRANTSA